jgi:hypothetical protein
LKNAGKRVDTPAPAATHGNMWVVLRTGHTHREKKDAGTWDASGAPRWTASGTDNASSGFGAGGNPIHG